MIIKAVSEKPKKETTSQYIKEIITIVVVALTLDLAGIFVRGILLKNGLQIWDSLLLWIGGKNSANYINALGIAVNVLALVGVAGITFYGTTYIYRKQKKDERQRLQEELHLILNEMGKNMRMLCYLKRTIKQFDEECKNEIKNREALGKVVNLWKEFDSVQRGEDYLFNYHQYYSIFAKEVEINYRTGEKVQLSVLEEKIEKLQQMIRQQYEAAFEIKEKMKTVHSLFTDKMPTGVEGKGLVKEEENSSVKRIDRMLRNEGMDVDLISDSDLDSIQFTYKHTNQFVKRLRSFVENADRLDKEITNKNMFPDLVRETYFEGE